MNTSTIATSAVAQSFRGTDTSVLTFDGVFAWSATLFFGFAVVIILRIFIRNLKRSREPEYKDISRDK